MFGETLTAVVVGLIGVSTLWLGVEIAGGMLFGAASDRD